ncbi:hypothetical protein [Nesterenkonia sp. HG001]|uniref:hypothetical protein n=1 Tax=Nesterenkonia sp. HG001 TaxID=2983207 RepID=UPI002AC79450|nr:hypothetical protein [Nesterenkonia sp. HG001]MDZ5078816.1 hypothetical protein [Nesterenkonia sp. HG001]
MRCRPLRGRPIAFSRTRGISIQVFFVDPCAILISGALGIGGLPSLLGTFVVARRFVVFELKILTGSAASEGQSRQGGHAEAGTGKPVLV